MPTLHFTTPGLRVRLEGERLLITPPPDADSPTTPDSPPPPPQPVHLRDIERLCLTEHTAISLAALAELLRRSIPIILLDHRGSLLGFLQPPAPLRTAARAQFLRSTDPAFTLPLAASLIEAKILNQRRVLQRLATNRPHAEISPTLLKLDHLAQDALTTTSLDSLRGTEGAAAGLYFSTYASFFPPHAPFQHRSRRPPHNPPNAILSYAYTLLTAECEALLHTLGLDPATGLYHQPADLRPALALDLIEPFRAPLADALALDLLSHSTLHPATHFDYRDGGCFLNTEGRRRFFVAYERRMDREFTSTHTQRRTSLRRELELQARAFRDAFLHGTMPIPFRMN